MFDHVLIACRPFSNVNDKYEIKIIKINILKVTEKTKFKKKIWKKKRKKWKNNKITKFMEIKKIIKSNNKILEKAHENK